MFGTVKRIIDWCGSFKKNLYIGFSFSIFFRLVCSNAGHMGGIYDREACRMRRTWEKLSQRFGLEKASGFCCSSFSCVFCLII